MVVHVIFFSGSRALLWREKVHLPWRVLAVLGDVSMIFYMCVFSLDIAEDTIGLVI